MLPCDEPTSLLTILNDPALIRDANKNKDTSLQIRKDTGLLKMQKKYVDNAC
jgi:hypothetical protein